MSDSSVTLGEVTDTVKAEKMVGWNMGFEGRFNKLLGIEVDYVNATQDVRYVGSTIGTDSSTGWGASLGCDISPWKHFCFYAGLKYLNVNLEMDNGQTADVKPLVARLGALVRF